MRLFKLRQRAWLRGLLILACADKFVLTNNGTPKTLKQTEPLTLDELDAVLVKGTR